MKEESALYGITKTNRSAQDLWTKNCFNSSFPAALACWMRDSNLPAIAIQRAAGGGFFEGTVAIEQVLGTDAPNSEITFEFESGFPAYSTYAYDRVTGIDLVTKVGDEYCRPLEIKLTVVPDNSTASLPEQEWGSEIVIRPATTQFAALGIIHAQSGNNDALLNHLDPACSSVENWNNSIEMYERFPDIHAAVASALDTVAESQLPFLLQPVWKTEGKTPALAELCFDLFAWSDQAIANLILAASQNSYATAVARKSKNRSPNRYMRACLRFARILWEISRGKRTNISAIFTNMTFGLQTDKEFALSGKSLRQISGVTAFSAPRIPRNVLRDIVLNDGHKLLSPERRFDATVFFTAQDLFENDQTADGPKLMLVADDDT